MKNNTKARTLNDHSIVCRNPGLLARRTPCCINLYDEDNLPVLALNETSALIWDNCDGELAVCDLINQFHATFPDIPFEDIKTDIMGVLNKFQQEGVIKLLETNN